MLILNDSVLFCTLVIKTYLLLLCFLFHFLFLVMDAGCSAEGIFKSLKSELIIFYLCFEKIDSTFFTEKVHKLDNSI